ncbi:hypothetical protein ACFL3G_12000 [Planctomycetota bacterium]
MGTGILKKYKNLCLAAEYHDLLIPDYKEVKGSPASYPFKISLFVDRT